MDLTAATRGQRRTIAGWPRCIRRIVLLGAPARGNAMGRRFLDDTGATLVEFALSVLILMAILFGIIETCFGLYACNYVSDAAREATRYAIVRGSSCTGMPDCGATQAQIQTYVSSLTYPGINTSNVTVTVTWLSLNSTPPTAWTACAGQCNAPGNAVQVQVTYPFALNIPSWKKSTVNLNSTSQAVISQ
jgi:Flp pilus assembly protein TadG